MLNKPHPFIFNAYSVLIPSVVTFMVLLILRPFEFSTFTDKELILWSAVFAVLVGSTILITVLILKKAFQNTIEENWTVKKEIFLILFVLVMISSVIFTLFLILNPEANWLNIFNLVVVRTLAISFFPVLILVLYEQNHYQKIQRRQAEQLNQELLKKQHSVAQETHKINYPAKAVLVAENEKIALQIDPMDLLFVKSEGNYVEVFYHQNGRIHKELIRNSLKAIEEQLSVSVFFRCHNRFLINLHHIQKVEGNARNFELSLANIEEKIPVSRGKSETLLQLFQQKP
ncbi:LytTR family DNA-binding domain-containing protein [Fulvivirga sp.]|uniref:LytR/AlgR family response regulator transcription factor n=1 Tax=Fulvivirga sp. TaxID=1931237 RepID=UPI0032EF6F00